MTAATAPATPPDDQTPDDPGEPRPGSLDPGRLRAVVTARARELGLTRNALAREAGVGRSTLFDWLAGQGQPYPSGWLGLARALQWTVSELHDQLGTPLPAGFETARMNLGLSHNDVSRRAGVAMGTIRVLAAGGKVRPDAARRVATALGLPGEFIVAVSTRAGGAATEMATRIQAERVARGWTITDVARMLGVTRQQVGAWLSGKEQIAAHWLPALEEFVAGAGPAEPPAPATGD